MEWTIDFLGVTEFVANEVIPEKVLRREGDQIWRACLRPFTRDVHLDDTAWSLSRSGELVRIPLVPYTCKSSGRIVGAVIERGIYIANAVAARGNVIRGHIVVGEPIETLSNGYRFWVGLAIREA
jgi:hypothetical protein